MSSSLSSGVGAQESRFHSDVGSTGKRIVITTFGSLGDLHPYLGLALGLKARGHFPVIATSEFYRERAVALGVEFAPVRPDLPDWKSDRALMKRVMDMRKGSEHIIREMFMPVLRDSYSDILAAAQNADLLVSHPLTWGTPLAAEKLGLPWASTMLAPLGFFSAYDPPVLPQGPWAEKLRFLGPAFWGMVFRFARWMCRPWTAPYRKLRSDLGLPPTKLDPLFEGQHSPQLVLAMFSSLLAKRQPDWPASTAITGFAYYDRMQPGNGLPADLAQFLEDGAPPIVFTLGSSAVLDAGSFYEFAAQAADRLGRRAVLLIGEDERNRLPSLPNGVVAFDYAPYSELFPRAAAIVHQGGAGTTGQAMRAGRPMLVMPYAHDQPDNAARMLRLGIARTMPRNACTVERMTRELDRLLGEPTYARKAADVGQFVNQEDGISAACDRLERLLGIRAGSNANQTVKSDVGEPLTGSSTALPVIGKHF